MQDHHLYQQILGIASPWHVKRVELKLEDAEVHVHQTPLHAAAPRTRCEEPGVRLVRLPWAEPQSRFTALFERLAIDWLSAASQQAVAVRLGLSWDEMHGIMQRAVQRGLQRRQAEKASYLGVDRKGVSQGASLCDDRHRSGTWLRDGCRQRADQASLDGFWAAWKPYFNCSSSRAISRCMGRV
jgi:hypothetical protein